MNFTTFTRRITLAYKVATRLALNKCNCTCTPETLRKLAAMLKKPTISDRPTIALDFLSAYFAGVCSKNDAQLQGYQQIVKTRA